VKTTGNAEVILLDTHVLLWWAAGDRAKLSEAAATLLDLEDPIDGAGQSQSIIVSSITAWEIAQLVERGRIRAYPHVTTIW
jgi:PIN domain nuclease of toxin-antitoxin system